MEEKDMVTLPTNPTLKDMQTYVAHKCIERGWTNRTDVERVMMLTEEIGEVAKEVRKHAGKLGYNKRNDTNDLANELVDVLNWIIDIANNNLIDLEPSFRKKWEHIDHRTWDIA